ncbi:hypothetical protein ABB37_02988 [Leptomonas pyrrhocoris]|uniref:Transmembrane protein n=1 Tax=Leptomonas pyrrhocoris TaxID=157538 RepID=A0A0N0DXT7_LEPPY|nr:hypothetical protein ABB37_02988 [Leptomonas pyrrhocoris]KPA83332.1 hypothetical protein ABB37_02988 [Leptomonas pyrrhocoris]|eukprot:XP_015661771.1 hypothetical protein ABB37_02988 [Leptomonas pyrrhocoris]
MRCSSRHGLLREAPCAFLVVLLIGSIIGSVAALNTAAGPYRVSDDCGAKRLTENTFEHDTQATSGMTSGNWLIFFVPSNEGATAQHFSQQTVHEIAMFEAFVKLPKATLDTYQVVPAYVVCDESPALCLRFSEGKLSSRLVLLSNSRMYPYPKDHIRTVDDIELFVTIFRRIQSSAIPPVRPTMAVWGQLALLVVGVLGIFLVRSYSMSRMYGPLPPGGPTPHSKDE